MTEPPECLDGARVLEFAIVDDRVVWTRNTKLWRDGRLQPAARALVIAVYDDASPPADFYLFYCDAAWNVMNDTCHVTLDGARQQAEFEYAGITQVWITRAADGV